MKFSFFFYMLISTANGFTRSHQRFRAKALRLQPRFSTSDRIEHKPIGLLDTEKDTNLLIDTNVNSLSQINSIAILNFVAILWGSQHVCIKSSIDLYESTSILNLWRFTMSTVLFLKPLLEFISKKPDRFDPTLRGGLELGLWTFLGFGCQAIGLETTTAGRSAFLLYLNVKLVPIFARSLYNRPISNQTWLSAALALFGTILLSYDGSPPNTGDLWCIAAAAASAMFILRLEKFSKSTVAAELNGVTFATVTAICAIWVTADILLPTSAIHSANFEETVSSIVLPFLHSPWPVIYLGFIATGLCNYLQTLGQRHVPAERAAVIYSLDPVYGAIFAYLVLHETLGVLGLLGVVFVLMGVFVGNYNALAVVAAPTALSLEDQDSQPI